MIDNLKPCTYDKFFSSEPKTGINVGNDIIEEINNNLDNSDLVLAFITEDYIRSVYCLYELSVAVYKKIVVIPIIFDKNGISVIQNLLGNNIFYVDMNLTNAKEILIISLNKYLKFQYVFLNDKTKLIPNKAIKEYIGSFNVYDNILKYCDEYGIKKFKNYTLSKEDLQANLQNSKELKIISTTGDSLIESISTSILPQLLSEKCNVTILMPNKYSSFCNDVASIEEYEYGNSLENLAQEFANVETFQCFLMMSNNILTSITIFFS